MNESLDRVETEQKPEPERLRKEKKAKKPKTGRQYISRMAWAKAIAYVLMLLFFAALVLGVFEALLSYDHLWRFSSAGEYTATLDDDLGHYDALWTRYTAYCRNALADDYASKKLIDFEKLT